MTISTHSSIAPRMVDQPGVRFGLASGALVIALVVAAALPLDLGETAFVALLVAGVASTALPLVFALVMGVEAWAYFTGFFENRYGVLTVAAPDLLNLAGFVVATLVLAHLVRVMFASATEGDSHEGGTRG